MILTSTSRLLQVPKRIISLVPSQTELLYHLGLEEETIGITKFCIHPEKWFRNKIRVGGTKSIDIQKIKELNPDLIIANKEENIKEQVEELAEQFPIWITTVDNYSESIDMIEDISILTSTKTAAQTLLSKIKFEFKSLDIFTRIKVTYLIWRDPYMTIGKDTFIHSMMEKAGFENVFANQLRYPQISVEDIKASGCSLLLLSSEPYPFKQKHIDELQEQLPGITIKLVDGEMFSWYGSRLLLAPAYFKELRQEIGQ